MNKETSALEGFDTEYGFVIIPTEGEFKNHRFRISDLRVDEEPQENGDHYLRCNIDHLTAKGDEDEEYQGRYQEMVMTLIYEALLRKAKEVEEAEALLNNSGPLP